MHKNSLLNSSVIAHIWAIAALAFLASYNYAFLFRMPYIGFSFNPSDGKVLNVFNSITSKPVLQAEDQLIKIGATNFQDFHDNLLTPFLENNEPGQLVEITILRNGEKLAVTWKLPGLNRAELVERLSSQWWIGYLFWIFGTFALLTIRPRDERTWLFAAFNFLTASWLVVGSLVSQNYWGSRIILRVLIWFCVPVYVHFHWVFPHPLHRLSHKWWIALYSAGGILALADIFQVLPNNTYLIGFFLAIVGSMILLLIHGIKYSNQRFIIFILGLYFGALILPIIGSSISEISWSAQFYIMAGILALPFIPAYYFYIVYRRNLGGLELRANQAIIIYLYAILLFGAILFLMPAATALFPNQAGSFFPGVIVSLLLGLITIGVYPKFARWAEQRLLGMPIPPRHLLDTFTSRIVTSVDEERLVQQLTEQILPSLMVRQAALLCLDSHNAFTVVFSLGINHTEWPRQAEIPLLLDMTGRFRREAENLASLQPCRWVRLALKFPIDNQRIGLILLGRRDPDDYYHASEIPFLQTLANQIGLALVNVDQSRRLKDFYRNDIIRQEAEANRLALELHDIVLGELAILRMNVDEAITSPQFENAYQSTINHLRLIIQGLRPAMLNFGLHLGLIDLADDLASQAHDGINIQLEIPENEIRYPAEVELHIYRIIQQACLNALEHASAKNLVISGSLEENELELVVTDDGTGFETGERLDVNSLLVKKHYGLAGMFERAALFGAQVQISSAIQKGTRVKVTWQAPQKMERGAGNGG